MGTLHDNKELDGVQQDKAAPRTKAWKRMLMMSAAGKALTAGAADG